MDLELRINGTAEELTSILELLKAKTGEVEVQDESLPIPSPDVIELQELTEGPKKAWTAELMDSFWSDISKSAQDFLVRCAVMSDALRWAPSGEFMCSNGGGLLDSCDPVEFLSRLEHVEPGSEPTEELFQCKNPIHMFSEEGVTEDELIYFAGWNPYAIGARLGNIKRTLNRPEYRGLLEPFFVLDNPFGPATMSSEEIDWNKGYRLRSSWAEYVFQKWIFDLEENNGKTFSGLSNEHSGVFPELLPMKRVAANNEIAIAKYQGTYETLFDGSKEREKEERIRKGYPF